MVEISEVVIDSPHPAGLARFGVAMLSDYRVRPYDASVRETCSDHTVMLDPEGNEFCVKEPGP
jgi:hypothetical protein